jgi:tetratricopeptide (TPR) repeat protein
MFLAMADFAAANLPLAAEESRKSIEIMQRVYGPHGHPQLAEFDAVLLEILTAQHQLAAAEDFGRQSVASFRQILPPGNPRLAAVLSGQAWALYRDGKFDQAASLLREALSIDTATFGPDLDQTAQVGVRLAACLLASGRKQEAQQLVRKYRAPLLASPNETYHEERAWLRLHNSMDESS